MPLPYRPTGQNTHDDAPDKLYRPAAHDDAVGDDEPAGQMYPALQLPLHDADDIPDVRPYRPAAQSTHTLAPLKLYRPATQATAVLFVDPAGQKCPAEHAPTHSELV